MMITDEQFFCKYCKNPTEKDSPHQTCLDEFNKLVWMKERVLYQFYKRTDNYITGNLNSLDQLHKKRYFRGCSILYFEQHNLDVFLPQWPKIDNIAQQIKELREELEALEAEQ